MLCGMELDFTQPPPKAKTLEEAQEIINALWIFCGDLLKRVELQQKEIEVLKEKLNTNSNNSSNPPSSDRYSSGKPPSGQGTRTRGGQKGHRGISRSLLPESDQASRYLVKQLGHPCPLTVPR